MKIYQLYEDSDDGFHLGTFSSLEKAQAFADNGVFELDYIPTGVIIVEDELDSPQGAKTVLKGVLDNIDKWDWM